MYIKKGDKVQVLSGKDRGKQGVVLRALPAENKVVVEGVSVVKKAVKPNAANQQGGIVSQEAPIDASNVNLSLAPSAVMLPASVTRRTARTSCASARSAATSSKLPATTSCQQRPGCPTASGPFSIPTHWGQT